MGQYFLIVNPVKRQYVDPGGFEMNQKRSGLMQGLPGLAVGLLVADDFSEGGPTGLLGSWVGDPVVAAGDDDGRPNPDGIRTTSEAESKRNLHRLAREECEDITPQAIAMLAYFGYATELAEFSLTHDEALRYLGAVVFILKCQPLKETLDRPGSQMARTLQVGLSVRHYMPSNKELDPTAARLAGVACAAAGQFQR